MEKNAIKQYLIQNGLNFIKDELSEDNCFKLNFRYEFDECEIEAARAYSKEEFGEYIQHIIVQYIKELSIDMVDQILDDLRDEMEIDIELKFNYIEGMEYSEFTAAFFI